MKFELQIDEEYQELARHLGFNDVEQMIMHSIDQVKLAKDCHALQGRKTKKGGTVLIQFQNPKLTKAQKLAKSPKR